MGGLDCLVFLRESLEHVQEVALPIVLALFAVLHGKFPASPPARGGVLDLEPNGLNHWQKSVPYIRLSYTELDVSVTDLLECFCNVLR